MPVQFNPIDDYHICMSLILLIGYIHIPFVMLNYIRNNNIQTKNSTKISAYFPLPHGESESCYFQKVWKKDEQLILIFMSFRGCGTRKGLWNWIEVQFSLLTCTIMHISIGISDTYAAKSLSEMIIRTSIPGLNVKPTRSYTF